MDLNRAATFIRVVESGGFTSAAHVLRVPPSSVSRSVAKLEVELGVTLLERTTRKVSLTEAGRAYFERAREALAGLDEANALAIDAAREPQGVVRLGVPPAFAPMMASTIAELALRYPRIEVDVLATARAAELVGETIDLALVIGRQADSSLISRKIGEVEQQLYAAPAYVAQRGAPIDLDALRDRSAHATIGLRPGGDQWELRGPRGEERVEVRARVRGDHAGFVIEAAVAGLGIALLPTLPANQYVARQMLVPVLPAYRAGAPLMVLTPGTRSIPRRTALFRDHLVASWQLRCENPSNGGCPSSATEGC
jgi:DNA-binding transcriptional LysR family regulator